MKTLYLVGNGFDIQHGIRTPYSEFRSFLETHHESFLTDFEAMYNIQPLDDTEPWYTEAAQERWKKSVLKDLWQTFEEEMGNPDVEGMHDMASSLAEQMPEEGIKYTLDLHWKEQYGFSSDLQKYVLEWLESIDTSGVCPIKKSFIGNCSDIFINFNYTDVLERVYGVKTVLHLHGGVPSCSAIPPIMGHGNKFIIDYYKRRAQCASEEFVEWEESICSAIAKFCSSLYKDTDAIISRNESFFSSLKDIEQVVSIGLSFGNVDTPYLLRIAEEIKPTSKWIIYYYSEDDKKRLKDVFGILDTVDKSVVLWYNEEKRTGVFLHGEQLSTARYVRCDVGNSQAVHNRKQGNVGRERKGYPSISEWRVLDFENGSTMERPAAGIW